MAPRERHVVYMLSTFIAGVACLNHPEFKEYFQYRVRTFCGIPEITLEGTIGDWTALKEKAMALRDFDLSWWTDELGTVLGPICGGCFW